MERVLGERVWTVEDLDAMPDDGLRYELVDGVLLVSPSPARAHQRAVGNLYVLLRAACPAPWEVLLAPMDFRPTASRSLQPDLLVASREDPGQGPLTHPLVLAVEVLSPSSRSVDQLLKRGLYEEAGVQQYWLVDPLVPDVTVLTLVDGRYVDPVVVTGSDELLVEAPLRVTLVPDALAR